VSSTSVDPAPIYRSRRALAVASLALALLASVAATAAALWLPIVATDEVSPTVGGATGQVVLSPGSPSVPESIFQRNGWIVLVFVGVPILLALLVGALLAWWMRMGAPAARAAAFVCSGVLALGGLVGLVTFLVGGVFLPIAALLLFACLIAPAPDTRDGSDGRRGAAGVLGPVP